MCKQSLHTYHEHVSEKQIMLRTFISQSGCLQIRYTHISIWQSADPIYPYLNLAASTRYTPFSIWLSAGPIHPYHNLAVCRPNTPISHFGCLQFQYTHIIIWLYACQYIVSMRYWWKWSLNIYHLAVRRDPEWDSESMSKKKVSLR